ncbi:MAG: hypothetical protein C4520_01100 [Candidatus Abyssobacteria bacterium SURF_5]|uniref:Uncharacterized protein n=1 Tax=Abyssobacteria bacterium (strain SURF_5) TaxID=2093360 RepID=A0A3A4P5T4_ABYX5|nr:MAG: hypothetical protein C4520_01100 [Candidatus Abyssubacteria bacterium SURF_5]
MTTDSASQWLEILRKEYLQDFIRGGGSAVKFIMPSKEIAPEDLIGRLKIASEEEGFQFASIDAAHTKIHMIDRLFNDIARQVDWDGLASNFLGRLIVNNGCRLQENSKKLKLNEIAALNGLEEKFLIIDIRKWLEKDIYRDYGMSQEFRIAMRKMCLAQLEEDQDPSFFRDLVKQWLQGQISRISLLKEALIFQKINRCNARHILFSLVHWLRRNERSGMVLVLDSFSTV